MRDKIVDFIKFEILWNLPELHWHRYYYRIMGYAIVGAGAGLIIDELINADSLDWNPANHEFWGLLCIIGGLYLISKKLHGKDL